MVNYETRFSMSYLYRVEKAVSVGLPTLGSNSGAGLCDHSADLISHIPKGSVQMYLESTVHYSSSQLLFTCVSLQTKVQFLRVYRNKSLCTFCAYSEVCR